MSWEQEERALSAGATGGGRAGPRSEVDGTEGGLPGRGTAAPHAGLPAAWAGLQRTVAWWHLGSHRVQGAVRVPSEVPCTRSWV